MTQPVTLQPGLQNVIPNKSSIPQEDNSESLKYLQDLESVTVQQDLQNDLQEGCGSSNTYNVFGNDGQSLFRVIESSSCLCRWCCGPSRQFQMEVYTPNQRDPILYFKRPFCPCEDICVCLNCCCCSNKILVYDTNYQYLGKALQRLSLFSEEFQIKNQNEESVALIKRFCLPCRCSRNIQFETFCGNGMNLGVIQKKWMRKHSNGFSFDHESFWISFPASLNTETKALLIGAAFLLNVAYFEMS